MSKGIVIRSAELKDSEGIARVHTKSWQSAYRLLLPDEWLDALRWQDRKRRWDVVLSESTTTKVFVASSSHNGIVGFASSGPSRDEGTAGEDVYELYAIYLLPEIWRTGIGAKLLKKVASTIPKGFRSISLWVLKENLQGRHFYESQGFVLDGATKMADIDGHLREEVRYRKRLSVDPER